ncbi:hypothetical protein pb186bvf_014175 [Paramecium bursaria]
MIHNFDYMVYVNSLFVSYHAIYKQIQYLNQMKCSNLIYRFTFNLQITESNLSSKQLVKTQQKI